MDMTAPPGVQGRTIPLHTPDYRVTPGTQPRLEHIPSRAGENTWKGPAKKMRADLRTHLVNLHNILYAEGGRGILVVLQAMDACGKDSTIRRCFGMLNPQRCRTHSFKQPDRREKKHDFLWRIHYRAPARGTIGIFNRSHYESVLVEKVKNLAPPEIIEQRYEHINAFEAMLADEGTEVIKFYLHASKAYQKERLERRLRRPDKRWKFNKNDLAERKWWDDYMRVYEETFRRCSSTHAPWYIIPAERRWFRDAAILKILVERIEALGLELPRPDLDLQSITIPD
ncbi:MAG: polyphosphate kinase 2 family protein [Chitinivibrionales bacterium]|nr:polyphosphate kinase 2 family protein [Chitinivibrionales bacterium]